MEDDDQKGKSSDELTPDEPERKDDDEVNDERKTGLESLARIKPVDDVLKDNNFKDGTRASAKPKSDKNPVIEKGEKSEFKTHNELVCKPCKKVFNGKSSLNTHMQEVSDMENDEQKGRSSDESTPNEPERKDDDKVDKERKIGSESSARIRPAYDALEDIYFEDGTKVAAKRTRKAEI